MKTPFRESEGMNKCLDKIFFEVIYFQKFNLNFMPNNKKFSKLIYLLF
jgi:hypothetical protein